MKANQSPLSLSGRLETRAEPVWTWSQAPKKVMNIEGGLGLNDLEVPFEVGN